jgi:Chemoreceptor zinc-binding domain
MNLDQAIAKHAEWKLKFRSAISSRSTMDVAAVSQDNCCDLGRWLHGEAKAKFGALGSYARCVSDHADFHAHAGRVAQTINAKRYADAEDMIKAGTPYMRSSSTVAVSIMGLKREAGL